MINFNIIFNLVFIILNYILINKIVNNLKKYEMFDTNNGDDGNLNTTNVKALGYFASNIMSCNNNSYGDCDNSTLDIRSKPLPCPNGPTGPTSPTSPPSSGNIIIESPNTQPLNFKLNPGGQGNAFPIGTIIPFTLTDDIRKPTDSFGHDETYYSTLDQNNNIYWNIKNLHTDLKYSSSTEKYWIPPFPNKTILKSGDFIKKIYPIDECWYPCWGNPYNYSEKENPVNRLSKNIPTIPPCVALNNNFKNKNIPDLIDKFIINTSENNIVGSYVNHSGTNIPLRDHTHILKQRYVGLNRSKQVTGLGGGDKESVLTGYINPKLTDYVYTSSGVWNRDKYYPEVLSGQGDVPINTTVSMCNDNTSGCFKSSAQIQPTDNKWIFDNVDDGTNIIQNANIPTSVRLSYWIRIN